MTSVEDLAVVPYIQVRNNCLEVERCALFLCRLPISQLLLPETRYDRNERRRLLREARVTAQLQHPNTVPVYDIGDDLQHGIYFVMKRISGENLFEILKRIARGDEPTIAAFPVRRCEGHDACAKPCSES